MRSVHHLTVFLMLIINSNITAQVWANMVSNCDLDSTITPANDFSNALE